MTGSIDRGCRRWSKRGTRAFLCVCSVGCWRIFQPYVAVGSLAFGTACSLRSTNRGARFFVVSGFLVCRVVSFCYPDLIRGCLRALAFTDRVRIDRRCAGSGGSGCRITGPTLVPHAAKVELSAGGSGGLPCGVQARGTGESVQPGMGARRLIYGLSIKGRRVTFVRKNVSRSRREVLVGKGLRIFKNFLGGVFRDELVRTERM